MKKTLVLLITLFTTAIAMGQYCDATFKYNQVDGNVFFELDRPYTPNWKNYSLKYAVDSKIVVHNANQSNQKIIFPNQGSYTVCAYLEDTVNNNCVISYCDSVYVKNTIECKSKLDYYFLKSDNVSKLVHFKSQSTGHSLKMSTKIESKVYTGNSFSHVFSTAGTKKAIHYIESLTTGCKDTSETIINVEDVAGFGIEVDTSSTSKIGEVNFDVDLTTYSNYSCDMIVNGKIVDSNITTGNFNYFIGLDYTPVIFILRDLDRRFMAQKEFVFDFRKYQCKLDFDIVISDSNLYEAHFIDKSTYPIQPTVKKLEMKYKNISSKEVILKLDPSKKIQLPNVSHCYFTYSVDSHLCPKYTTLYYIRSVLARFSVEKDTINKAYKIYNKSLGDSLNYKWWFGDGDSSTEAHPTHTYQQYGTYMIKLGVTKESHADYYVDSIGIDADGNFLHKKEGFSISVVPFFDTPTSIQQNEALNIEAYPNPTNEMVTINSDATIKQVKLLSLSGKELTTEVHIQGKSAELNLSKHPNGIYLIKIMNTNGIKTFKINKN